VAGGRIPSPQQLWSVAFAILREGGGGHAGALWQLLFVNGGRGGGFLVTSAMVGGSVKGSGDASQTSEKATDKVEKKERQENK